MADLTLIAVTLDNSAMGTVSIEKNQLKYMPASGYSGPASGTYTAQNGTGKQSTAAWSGVVEAWAVADLNAFTVPVDTQQVFVDVLENDFSPTTWKRSLLAR